MLKPYDETVTGTEPVAAADLASVLKGTAPAENPFLDLCCVAARQQVEKHCRIAIVKKTITMFMDRFPYKTKGEWWDGVREMPMSELYEAQRDIFIPSPPLISITSVTTYDDSDTGTVFASTNYYVAAASKNQQGRIVLRQGAVWPNALRVADAIKVIYEAGYNNGAVPTDLKMAILGVAAYLYSNRGDCSGEPVQASGMGALCQSFIIREPR